MSRESGQGRSGGGTKGELGTKLRGSTHTQCSNCRGLGAAGILFEALIVSQGYLFGCPRSYIWILVFLLSVFDTMGLVVEEWRNVCAKLTRHGCVNVDKMIQAGVGPQWSVKVPQKALLD
jgi:hypothetical protein